MTVDRRRHARPELEALRALADERLERRRSPRSRPRAPPRRAPSRRRPARRRGRRRSGRRAARRAARRAPASRSRSGRSPSASGGQSPRREKTRVSAGSAGASVSAAPPAPITHARVASIPARISRSVLKPSTRPSRKTSVLTASPSASSHAATTACLCGIVTFAPAKPSVAQRARPPRRRPRRRTPSSASRARARRTRRSASAARASARPDGRAARRARVISRSRASRGTASNAVVARGEEVVQVVGLAREVEVVDLRRVRGRLDRGEAGVRDRRRRQARPVARVVRRRALRAATA